MRSIILFLLLGILLASSACRSARSCRSVKAEETALQYLVDSILSTAYKDSVEIFINPEIKSCRIISFRYVIAGYFTDTNWIKETIIKLNDTNESVTVYDCRKKRKYPLWGVKLKTPKGYRRRDWSTYLRTNKKGKNTDIIQLFNFGRWINQKFYIDFSCYNHESYLIVLDRHLNVTDWYLLTNYSSIY